MPGSRPRNMADADGTLFFSAYTPTTGFELWKSDGTAAGTILLKDIVVGVQGSEPRNLFAVGDRVYFQVQTSSGSSGALWVSDGTPEGTKPVASIAVNHGIDQFAAVDDVLFTPGGELRAYSYGELTPLRSPTLVRMSARPTILSRRATECSTAADDNGRELWVSDGTAAARPASAISATERPTAELRTLPRSEIWCTSRPSDRKRAANFGPATARRPARDWSKTLSPAQGIHFWTT